MVDSTMAINVLAGRICRRITEIATSRGVLGEGDPRFLAVCEEVGRELGYTVEQMADILDEAGEEDVFGVFGHQKGG